jgi:uncharacterized protein
MSEGSTKGLIAGLFLACGLCFSSMIVTKTWTHIKETQIIEVTGSVRKNVRSDLAIFEFTLQTEDKTISGAYSKLKTDIAKLDTFIKEHGNYKYTVLGHLVKDIVPKANKDDASLDDNKIQQRVGYQLSQAIRITSDNIDGVIDFHDKVTSLLDEGLIIIDNGIRFQYTKISELKRTLLGQATDDARLRAEQIASLGGRKLGLLRSAKAGVFQINALNETETSSQGNNDTTSVEKTVMVTVSAQFLLK